MKRFYKFSENLRKYYNFNIKFKNESLFMKCLGKLLFFNKHFMTNYVTTIGNTIYFPDKESIELYGNNYCNLLAHEIVHIEQSRLYGRFLFSIMYLFPQVLSIFSLLFFISPWFLCFLIFVLPFPAIFRKNFEYDAYLMSLEFLKMQLKERGMENKAFLETYTNTCIYYEKQFYGPEYWYMWPFKIFLNRSSIRKKDFLSDIYDCIECAYKSSTS